MKKLIMVLLACLLVMSLTACSNNGTTNEESSSQTVTTEQSSDSSETSQELSSSSEDETSPEASQSAEPQTQESAGSGTRSLVVYFSATGNTKSVAETLAEMQGADIYEIVPEQPYTDEDLNYNNSSSRATVEQNDETARPAILEGIDNFEDYDVVYVGFPIWWGDMPRILYTFFDTYDLSGKTIVPFGTSGGSGISRAVQTIRELEPSVEIIDGLLTSSANAEDDLVEWLNNIGLAGQE